jgi:predicted metal-dependent TIM-barrel fold hydrolase
MGTMSLLWNEKTQAETIVIANPIFAGEKYHTEISEDETKVKRKAFAFAKTLQPYIVETTREQYKAAAKKALERFADAFIAKAKAMKK